MTYKYYKSWITNLADGNIKYLEQQLRFYYRLSSILFIMVAILFTIVMLGNKINNFLSELLIIPVGIIGFIFLIEFIFVIFGDKHGYLKIRKMKKKIKKINQTGGKQNDR